MKFILPGIPRVRHNKTFYLSRANINAMLKWPAYKMTTPLIILAVNVTSILSINTLVKLL